MDWKVLKSQWDRVAAVGLMLAGAVSLIAGYLQVADSKFLAEQTRFITSGGLGGLYLLGLGATLWISADLRDEWRKLDRIERALADGVLRWMDAPASAGTSTGRESAPVAPENGSATDLDSTLAHSVRSREHA
ncbi:hypothetical protein [Sporichthya polymorpha]|uniref:hypothetical protein n=1 Tax=Sporichthya polymorpha TaxID=35751 RepID=UPI00035FDA11|nr:hypothetical protein [Sporichthya polymorpha]